MTKPEKVSIITRVPPELRQRFKAACAARGVSMSATILAAIQTAIQKYEFKK